MLCSLGLDIRTFTAIVFGGFAKVLGRLSASTIDCAFLAFHFGCNVRHLYSTSMIDSCAFKAFDFCCTVPCVFSISEIMLFTFRLLVVVSVGLLVPFATLLSAHYHCLFLLRFFFFFFIFNNNKQGILAGRKEMKIKAQIEVLDEKLTGVILQQKYKVR